MPIRGVILDLDGTLIDSNEAHARAWVEAMAEFGFRPGVEMVRRLIGMGGKFLLPQATGVSAESEIGKEISALRRNIFLERYLPELRPFPKARELLLRMQAGGLKRVVASASKRDEVEAMLKQAGIDDLADGTTSASDVDDPKPESDVIEAALKKLALPPQEVLLLGDTPYDIEAAGKVGVGAVILRTGGWEDQALTGARAIYRDPAELLVRYEESPFFLER